MNSFFVYVLYSASIDRYYIGQTQNLEERLKQHNTHHFKSSHTKQADDWEVFHSIPCQSRKQAVRIEMHLKRARKRKYLEDLKKYPEIAQKLKQKYSE